MKIDIRQLAFIHPFLRGVLLMTEPELGMELTITSLYRINDDGVHGTLPVRGADCRCRDPKVGKEIQDMVNSLYVYDEKRPDLQVCLMHGERGNLHLHFQVCNATKRRR